MAEMRYSLVAYLEILTPAEEPDEATWAMISERIHRWPADLDGWAALNERRAFQLDNVLVLVQPLDMQYSSRTPPWLPFHLLLRLAYLQESSWADGVFFRGAVAHGEALIGADAIVGPAVRMAQQQARQERVPRIMVDPRLLQAITHDPRLRTHGPRQELAYLKRLLAQDTDGLWFVDYLTIKGYQLEDSKLYADWLEDHCLLLEEVLERVGAQSEDVRPWLWLATYHDRVVAGLEDIDEATRDSLRIVSDTPLRFQF
jgi:hypothetical protein